MESEADNVPEAITSTVENLQLVTFGDEVTRHDRCHSHVATRLQQIHV
jgi:hypothetical protein